MNLPSASEALMSLAGFIRPRPAEPVQPEEPTPDPRQIIARPYGKSVLQSILDAPNLATAKHIYQGALGGAKGASSGTMRKWERALKGVERREREDGWPSPIMICPVCKEKLGAPPCTHEEAFYSGTLGPLVNWDRPEFIESEPSVDDLGDEE